MEDLILEPKRSDDEYFYYDWPVIGDVAIPKATVEKNKDNPAELNRAVVEAYAEWLTDKDIDLSSLDAFTNTFGREFTSTARGIMESGDGERTTTYEDELINELYSTMNSGAWWSGLITGALADPVTIPTTVLKLFKLGLVGQGVVTGGVGGFLQPDRPEWGTSTLGNTAAGAVAGGVLGGIFSRIYKALGVDSPEAAQRAFDEGGEQVKELIQKETKEVTETLFESEAKTAAQQIDQRQARADFENNLASQRAATDEMLARQYTEDYNNNLARIQNESAQRVSDEFNETLQRNQIEAQQQAFLNNIQAQNQRANLADIERDGLIAELQSRVETLRNAGSVEDAQAAVTMIRRQLDNNRQTELRMKEGAKTRINEETMLARRVFFNENLQKAEAKLAEAKALRDSRKQIAQLKAGKETPELKTRINEKLATLERKEVRPVPEVRPPEAPRNIQSVTERQLPPAPTPVQMQGGIPTPAQIVPQQGPISPPLAPPVQQPTSAIAGLFAPKASTPQQSMGAAAVNPMRMDAGAPQAATMNTRSAEAQALPPTTSTVSRMNPETGEMERMPLESDLPQTEQVRSAAMREASESQRELLRVDGFSGKSYDWDQMLQNADELEMELVLDSIDEGNYKSASDWLIDSVFNKGEVRILTPKEKLVAARIAGIARGRLIKLGRAQRQVAKDGYMNTESIKMLKEMEISGRLDDAMNELANIVNTVQMDRANTGQTLSALRLANQEYEKHIQKLNRGEFIERLFAGVDC